MRALLSLLIGLSAGLLADTAHALKLRNSDDVTHIVTITHTGNTEEVVTLQPGETHKILSPVVTLETGGYSTRARRFDEWVVSKGKLVLRRRNNRSHH